MLVARPRSSVVIVAQVSGQSLGQAPRTIWVSLSAMVAAVTAVHVRGGTCETPKYYVVRPRGATFPWWRPNTFDVMYLPAATVGHGTSLNDRSTRGELIDATRVSR